MLPLFNSLMNKALHQSIGGFDKENFKFICYDMDLCLRLKEAGYRNVWSPNAEIYNDVSLATSNFLKNNDRQKCLDKEIQFFKQGWKKLLLHDPAYNPNLTLDSEDFGLAWPPRVSPISLRGVSPIQGEKNSSKGLF